MVNLRKRESTDLSQCVDVLKRVHDEFAYPAQWPNDPAAWIANDTEQDAWIVETLKQSMAILRATSTVG